MRAGLAAVLDQDLRQFARADALADRRRVADLFALAVEAIEQVVDQWMEEKEHPDDFFQQLYLVVTARDVRQLVEQDAASDRRGQRVPMVRHENAPLPAAHEDRRAHIRVNS